MLFALLLVGVPAALAGQDAANPLSKTIELLDSLSAKITKEGEEEAKAYKEYVAWCDDAAANLKYDIKTGESKKSELEATISKTAADIEACDAKIEDLAGSIAADEKELREATSVRKKEAADFAASEAELVDAIDTLDRAVMVLEKEMKKNPASLAQMDTSNLNKMLKSLETVIDAAAFPVTDQKKLAALVQARQGADSDDDELGPPASAAYKSHSTSIFDVLEDMKEKAEGQLSDLRREESSTRHNFDMLKQSLTDQIEADTKDSNEEKATKAATQEAKATAEGEPAQRNGSPPDDGDDGDDWNADTDGKASTEGLSGRESDAKSWAEGVDPGHNLGLRQKLKPKRVFKRTYDDQLTKMVDTSGVVKSKTLETINDLIGVHEKMKEWKATNLEQAKVINSFHKDVNKVHEFAINEMKEKEGESLKSFNAIDLNSFGTDKSTLKPGMTVDG